MAEAYVDWMLRLLDSAGIWGILLAMMLDGACVPIPSELILPFGGFLAAQGRASLLGATLAANAGVVGGALMAYLAGRRGGRPLLERFGGYVGVGARELERAEGWFRRHGDLAVFAARFVPGLRTLISLPAGAAGMAPGRFLLYTFLGSLPWSFALTYAGYLLGRRWDQLRVHLGWLDRAAIAVVGALAAAWLWRAWRERRPA